MTGLDILLISRKAYPFSVECIEIHLYCTLDKVKNVELLLNAFIQLLNEEAIQHCDLVLVGIGPLDEELIIRELMHAVMNTSLATLPCVRNLLNLKQ